MPDTSPSPAPASQLTDDANTLRDGRKLATSARWSATGGGGTVVWGECQGSAKEPYRTCLDMGETGYKCTCPSRKQPCKHVVALALLHADQPDLFPASDAPDWVQTWQANREKRRAPKADKTPDPAAQAERASAREEKVRAGMEELRLWLQDLLRRGLTDDRVRTYEFWDRMAARMVDAQAASIGRRLRGMAGIPLRGTPNWAERLLDELASLYLLADAYQRLDTLPGETQADIRTVVGFTTKQEDLLNQPGVVDHWLVMGQHTEANERLRSRRVWLYGGHTGQHALLLDFAHGNAAFDHHFTNGTAFAATLVYYPGAVPMRAAIKTRQGVYYPEYPLVGFNDACIADMLERYAGALARNPWLDRMPVGLHAVTPFSVQSKLFVRDSTGAVLPVSSRAHPWFFAAASGNRPLPVFGEWDGYEFQPRTVLADGEFWAC